MPETWGLLGIVLLGAGLAGFVQGLSGFAFALVGLSVWAWALKPEVAAPLSVFGALLGQLTSLFSIRSGFEWKKIAPFVAGGLFGVPIGVFILHNVDPLRFRLAIGIFLTLYGLYGLLSPKMPTIAFGGRGLDAAIGGVGGVLGGLGGLSGSVPAIWTQLRGWKRDLRRATMQVYNITMHSLTLTVYWKTGALTAAALPLFAFAAPVMLIAAFAGARIYGRFSEKVFTRVILLLLLLSGAALVYGSARALAGLEEKNMNVDEALRRLGAMEGFPREALQWSLDHWSEASPRYLSKLRAAAGRGAPDEADADALFFIVHLFAEKRDSRAYAPLCDLIAIDPEIQKWLGDGVTSTLPGILINLFDGDPEPLHVAIEAVGADEFARGSALGALSYLVKTGQPPGELELLDYLKRLQRESGPRAPSYFWGSWADTASRMGYASLGPEVARLCSKGWIVREWMRIEDFHEDLATSRSQTDPMALFKKGNIEPFGSTIETLGAWSGFAERSGAGGHEPIDFDGAAALSEDRYYERPYVDPNRDVGRNDPCPCGSGRKYKKCCLAETL